MCAKQHVVLRFPGLDLFDHLTNVSRDRLVIEREQITQGRDPIAAAFDQLFLHQTNGRRIVVAQKSDDRVFLEHSRFYHFSRHQRKTWFRLFRPRPREG